MPDPAKLSPPKVLRAVERPRLFARLDSATSQPITWLCGPPGAGKTTLVATWLAARRRRARWYLLDRGDADLATFFFHLGGMARRPLPPLTPEVADTAAFARRFFRELASGLRRPLQLVFDDAQEVPASAPFWKVLREGLGALPPGSGAIFLSRAAPSPALARLRANGALEHVGPEDLRLTRDEVARMVRLWRGGGVPSDAARLHRVCDGWAAGLVLLLARSDGSEATAPVRAALFDYFAGEVLDGASDEVRTVLLELALPPRFTAELAERVTGRTAAPRILRDLAATGFFTVELAAPDRAYRLHPLFREFLLARGREELRAERVRAVRLAAAPLLAAAGQLDDALDLLEEAAAWSEAAALLRSEAPGLARTGRGDALARRIARLPREARCDDPWLLYWEGVGRFPHDLLGGRRLLEEAYAHFERAGEAPGAWLSWSALLAGALFDWGDVKQLDRWIDEFDRRISRAAAFPTPEIEWQVVTGFFTALVYRRPDHPDVERWRREAMRVAAGPGDVRTRLNAASALVQFAVWKGDFRAAETILDGLAAVARDARDDDPLAAIGWRVHDSAYGWTHGERARCDRAVEDGLAIARASGIHFWDTILTGNSVWSALLEDDLEAADAWLARMKASLNPALRLAAAYTYHAASTVALRHGDAAAAVEQARIALDLAIEVGSPVPIAYCRIGAAAALVARGRPEEAERLVAGADEIGTRMGSRLIRYSCLLQRAAWARARGDETSALAALAEALAIGAAGGPQLQPWLMPAQLADLCALAIARGIEPDHARLLARLARLAPPAWASDLEGWPWPVRILALGTFKLEVDGREIHASDDGERLGLLLLEALVAHGARRVPRSTLATALRRRGGGGALRPATAALRRLLGPRLVEDGDTLGLDPGACWVDVARLEARVRRDSSGTPSGAGCDAAEGCACAEQVALYRGPFLAHRDGVPWVEHVRSRVRDALVRTLRAPGDRHVELLRRAAEADPHLATHEASGAAAPDPGHRAHDIASRWGLTPRQTEVLARLARGDGNKAIAAELGCAESTVEMHVTAVLQKSSCDSRSQLVARFWTS